MARSKNSFTAILLIALVVAALVGLNPTTDDFEAWRVAQAKTQVQKEGGGAFLGGVAKGLTKAAISIVGTPRKNYYVCSTYSYGDERYLGIARLFIKIK